MAVSRRGFLSTGATLLAGFGAGAVLPPAVAAAASTTGSGTPPTGATDLALYRPVTASSTDYAPTPAQFAVDRLSAVGVKGTGWRAAQGDPQWIAVDLQAPCSIEAVTLVFEASLSDPAFNGNYGATSGQEVLSSAAVAFTLEVSGDGNSWQSVYRTASGAGGQMDIRLPQPVTARWIRMTSTARSSANPVGLNGFQVYGTCAVERPVVQGWTSWGTNRRTVPELAVAADGTVPLESGWSVTLDDFLASAGGVKLDGASLSGPAADTGDWLPATVPGTVQADLVAQGHLPDPVSGFNNLDIPEALSRHAWWYRRPFRLPAGLDTGPGRHVWLEFDGVNHQAIVWVDGTNVGTVTHPFARAAFDITAALSGHGDHALAVQVNPMPHPGTPGDKSSNGNTFVQSGSLYLDSPTYLAASGWDWMPAVRDRATGIWNHVRLRSTGDVVIGDPHVSTKLPGLPDTTTADVTIAIPVRNAGNVSHSVTVRAAFDDVSLSTTITIPAGQSATAAFSPEVFNQLHLHDPKLWWPNGYGDPDLHELRITATAGGSVSDRRTARFGIREFGYSYDTPIVVAPPGKPPLTFTGDAAPQTVTFARRQARYLRIQAGQRATQWGVSLWTLSVFDSSSPGADLALNRTATASSVDNGSDGPGNAVDGNAGTRWSSAYQDNQWIQVDLGASVSFDQVYLLWEQAYALDYRIQTSDDGATWSDAQSVTNTTPLGDFATQTEDFAAQNARYVRVQCGGRATQWGDSMWTLSVIDSSSPDTDLALNKTATASSADSGSNGPGNAVDGNPRTRWSSAYEDNQWIQVDLGAAAAFDRLVIVWEQAYARDYVIQVSPDGAAWTDVKSVDNTVTQLKISVNGVPVFCRGGNWGWDELLRRVLPDRMGASVAMHRDMNFTMIRNWIGSSNREEFFASCDENGILVWNDFWEAGNFADDQAGYLDTATDTIRRYRIHPCIAVWCGANEEAPPPDTDAGLAGAVAAEDGDVYYHSNSAGGVTSGHGPYHWIDPARYYDKNTYDTESFGFHTEIGMPVVSVVESMRNLVGRQPEWPISEVWNYHDWSTSGNQQTGAYQGAIENRLGAANSLADFCAKAQFVNYENTRAMFEAWNANLWQNTSGLLLWMSHPAWHSTVWQTYDYDLDVNGAYYGSRKGCEPLHVQANPATWQVLAANHTARPVTGASITAKLYDLSGRQLSHIEQQAMNIAASATAPAFTVSWPSTLPPLHLLRLELRGHDGALLSENTYWRYAAAQDMQALNSLARTRLAVSVHGVKAGGGGRDRLTATVANRGGTVAAMVRLALQDRTGARVLPAQYDENYFWLLPGESRRIAISWPSGATPRQGPQVSVQAYNAPTQIGR
jgi:hypothetical protein